MNWALIGLLAINLVFALAGETTAKYWAIHQTKTLLALGLTLTLITQVFFMLIVREGGLAIGGSIALVLTLIGTTLIGALFFKEILTYGQWFGIILGIISALFILNIVKLP